VSAIAGLVRDEIEDLRDEALTELLRRCGGRCHNPFAGFAMRDRRGGNHHRDAVLLHRPGSEQVVAVYEEERERWLGTHNSIRDLRVREVLDARTPVDVDGRQHRDSLPTAMAPSGAGDVVPHGGRRR